MVPDGGASSNIYVLAFM